MKASMLKPPAHAKRTFIPDSEDLQESFRRHGQLQPIVARRNGEVIIGERRRQALSPDQEASVVVLDIDEVGALEARLSEEFSRVGMTSVEKGEALRELIELLDARDEEKVTTSALAKRIGVGPDAIRTLLPLADLPEPVKTMEKRGEIGARVARALAKKQTTLTTQEKTKLAEKFAAEKAPAGERAAEVVSFAETAPEPVRRDFIENPSTSYEEAQRAAEREAARQRREEAEDRMAMREAPFFRRVTTDVRKWSRAMSSIIDLAAEVPESQKGDMRQCVTTLRDHCDRFLARMEGERPTAAAALLDRAEQEWA